MAATLAAVSGGIGTRVDSGIPLISCGPSGVGEGSGDGVAVGASVTAGWGCLVAESLSSPAKDATAVSVAIDGVGPAFCSTSGAGRVAGVSIFGGVAWVLLAATGEQAAMNSKMQRIARFI